MNLKKYKTKQKKILKAPYEGLCRVFKLKLKLKGKIMKFTLTALKKALTSLIKTVERKDDAMITSHIFFGGSDGIADLETTDGEVHTLIKLDTLDNDTIEIDVNLKDLKKFVGTLKNSDGDITFIEKNNNVIVTCGDYTKVFKQFDITDETISDINDFRELEDSIELSCNIPISEVIYSNIATNNPKYELNGVLIDFDNNKIVSTDTKSMSIQDFDSMGVKGTIIIPKKGVSKNIIMTDIKMNDNIISYFDGYQRVSSKLINGKYPNYTRIQSEKLFKVKVNGDELKDKLKKFGSEIEIEIRNNTLTVRDMVSGKGGAKSSLCCDYPTNEPFIFMVDTKYLIEAIADNEIELAFNENNLPFSVFSSGLDVVIMPNTGNQPLCDTQSISKAIFNSDSSFEYTKPVTKKATRTNHAKINKELNQKIKELEELIKSKDTQISDLQAQTSDLTVDNDNLREEVNTTKTELKQYQKEAKTTKRELFKKIVNNTKHKGIEKMEIKNAKEDKALILTNKIKEYYDYMYVEELQEGYFELVDGNRDKLVINGRYEDIMSFIDDAKNFVKEEVA